MGNQGFLDYSIFDLAPIFGPLFKLLSSAWQANITDSSAGGPYPNEPFSSILSRFCSEKCIKQLSIPHKKRTPSLKTGGSVYSVALLPLLDDFRTHFEVFKDIFLIKGLLSNVS